MHSKIMRRENTSGVEGAAPATIKSTKGDHHLIQDIPVMGDVRGDSEAACVSGRTDGEPTERLL